MEAFFGVCFSNLADEVDFIFMRCTEEYNAVAQFIHDRIGQVTQAVHGVGLGFGCYDADAADGFLAGENGVEIGEGCFLFELLQFLRPSS